MNNARVITQAMKKPGSKPLKWARIDKNVSDQWSLFFNAGRSFNTQMWGCSYPDLEKIEHIYEVSKG